MLFIQLLGSALLLVRAGAFVVNSGRTLDMAPQEVMLLHMKSPYRARVEHELEEAMGDDWRLFRAQLVAREKVEEEAIQQKKNKRRTGSSGSDTEHSDKLGDLFGAAISRVFYSRGSKESPSDQPSSNIWQGDSIGIPEYDDLSYEDPFVSEAELPIHLTPKPSTIVDKHRWAHSITHIEPGCVILANEKLAGVFRQTVVLITENNEKTGTKGVIINRPLQGDLHQVATERKTKVDISLKLAFSSSPVTYGGPVNSDEFTILHGYGEVEGSVKLAHGVYFGGEQEIMNQVRINGYDAERVLFMKGHAAWVPGQIEREIDRGVWYVASASRDFLLRYAGAPVTPEDDPNDLWKDILTCMGTDYAKIAAEHAGAGDKRRMP